LRIDLGLRVIYSGEVNLRGMRLLKLVFVFLLAAVAAPQEKERPTFDAQRARGAVVSSLTCLDDSAQSYALYLPSHYSPEQRWPIIYAFDPFARGKTAVEVYQAAAERYGYIVAASNNSKNGPVAPQLEAAQAVWNDTHRRFAIDRNRVYTTGLSGGARVATSFAMYCYTCAITGVIAHGAGYPVGLGTKQPANDHFIYYAAVGDADFNYPELALLRKKKDEQGAQFKLKVYPGPHQWAPPEIAEDAVAWLELKAMQAGTKKPDPLFIEGLFTATQAEAVQAEQHSDTLAQYYALRSLLFDFKGLKDASAWENKVTALKASKAWKSALQHEQREIDLQQSLVATAQGELAQFGSADPDAQISSGHRIASVLADLRRRAHANNNESTVYSRAFTQLFIQGMEAGQDEFRNNRLSAAAAYFELMAEAAPDQVWPLVALAEARVRAGNKKAALKALEEASQRGLKHPEALAQDLELQPLASEPAFQRIVQGAGAK
jgi:dienelactone hydrolase